VNIYWSKTSQRVHSIAVTAACLLGTRGQMFRGSTGVVVIECLTTADGNYRLSPSRWAR